MKRGEIDAQIRAVQDASARDAVKQWLRLLAKSPAEAEAFQPTMIAELMSAAKGHADK